MLNMSKAIESFSNKFRSDSVLENTFIHKAIKKDIFDIKHELSNRGKAKNDKKIFQKIVSPSIEGKIEIKKGLWIVPNVKFRNDQEREEWILSKKILFGINV